MAFDPNEARDPHGRWATGAGGEIPVAPDPRVATVASGDVWNKDTAARLENEYAAARPALDKIANQAPENVTTANIAPSGWEDLSGDTQDSAAEKYKSQNYDSEYDNEVNNWHEGGDPQFIAADALQHDEDWKTDTLAAYLAEREKNGLPEIPYNVDDLANAIHITAASSDDYSGSSGDVDPLIQFSASDLQKPTDLNPDAHHPDQLAMPGISPKLVAPEDHLTQEMRADMAAYFIKGFNHDVSKKSADVEPPDYLSDNVHETLDDSWGGMGDEEKYDWTKQNTSLIDDEPEDNTPHALDLPKKWDPLNETSGEDYKRTQAMAKYMADTRAVQIMRDRGLVSGERRFSWASYNTPDLQSHLGYKIGTLDKIVGEKGATADSIRKEVQGDIESMKDELKRRAESERTSPTIEDIRSVDHDLWDGWKGSSTGSAGQLLQVAAADELGGRLREAAPPKPDIDAAYKEFANSKVAQMGDLDEFAAAVKQLYASGDAGAFGVKISADKNMSEEQQKIAHDLLYYSNQTPPTYSQYTSAMAVSGSTGAVAVEKVSAQIVIDAYKAHQEAVAHGEPTTDKTPILKTELMKEDAVSAPYIKLPTLDLQRNGAASFTTDRSVANNWGGTANKASQGIDRARVIKDANLDYEKIGGYAGVKAAVRAKWETTQYMLDKADVPVLPLYRGITLSHRREGDPAEAPSKVYASPEMADKMAASQGSIAKAPSGDGHLIKDANGNWLPYSGVHPSNVPSPIMSRVVLRAEVPRTAVLSVPAYGQNIHSEHEVVITGTAWHNWDAYSDRAPRAEDIPIGKVMTGAEKERISAQLSKDAARKEAWTEFWAGPVLKGLEKNDTSFESWLKKAHPELTA